MKDNNDKYEFRPLLAEIEDTPTSPLGRAVLWTIVACILFSSIWLYFGTIDVVVSSRGKVIPEGEVKIIQAVDSGVIRSIHIKEGDYVKKDDILLEIDPSVTENYLSSKQKNLSFLNLQIARIEALLDHKSFAPDDNLYDSELIQIEKSVYDSLQTAHKNQIDSQLKELNAIKESQHTLQIEKERYKSLLKMSEEKKTRFDTIKDILSMDEYQAMQTELMNHRNTLKSTISKISEIEHKERQKEKEIAVTKENFRSNLLRELSSLQKEKAVQTAEIQAIEYSNTKQSVRSPINGHVKKLYIHTLGGVVNPAQELLEIVPESSPLVIKAVILNKDIGFISEGMDVSIKMDTYEFQKYGMLNGTVKHVGDDSIEDPQYGSIYELYINLKDTQLKYKDKIIAIEAGMSLTAEIKVGERRIIEFFIYPLIKHMDEGLNVR